MCSVKPVSALRQLITQIWRGRNTEQVTILISNRLIGWKKNAYLSYTQQSFSTTSSENRS